MDDVLFGCKSENVNFALIYHTDNQSDFYSTKFGS